MTTDQARQARGLRQLGAGSRFLANGSFARRSPVIMVVELVLHLRGRVCVMAQHPTERWHGTWAIDLVSFFDHGMPTKEWAAQRRVQKLARKEADRELERSRKLKGG